MNRKIISLLLSLLLILPLCGTAAYAEEICPANVSVDSTGTVYDGSCGDTVSWELDTEKGLLKISGKGAMSDYNEPWYFKYTLITTVEISEGVTYIGSCAFENLINLKRVSIPYSVTGIGAKAFARCALLEDVKLSENVRSVGPSAFADTAWYNAQPDGMVYINKIAYKYKGVMPGNTTVEISDGTLGIAGDAFADCRFLAGISLPDSLKTIGSGAFSGCTGLKSIDLPDGLEIINGRAFLDCAGLTGISLPSSLSSLGSAAFRNCSSLKSVVVPEKIEKISGSTFAGCTSLETVTFPEKISVFGESVFDECTSLEKIVYLGPASRWRFIITFYENNDILINTDVEFKREEPLNDAPLDSWFAEPVYWCYYRNYLKGTARGRFDPDGILTRAMFVQMLSRITGAHIGNYVHADYFTDVPVDAWYSDAVSWAFANGLTFGIGGNKFGPDDPLTREQLAVFLFSYVKMIGLEEKDVGYAAPDEYTDRDEISGWAVDAVGWAVENGMMVSTSTTEMKLSPGSSVTRAETATVIKAFISTVLQSA